MRVTSTPFESTTEGHPRRWWILLILCLSLMVLVVDNTVLNLAIPSLMRDLSATPADIQWVIDAYILAFAGLLLTAGSLSDRFGRRKMLLLGLVIFGVASLLATLAENPWQLIACRGLMGVGGGLAGPAAYTLLMQAVPPDHRGVGSAMNDTVQQTGAALSVAVLGSVLAAAYSSALPDSVPEAARKSIADTLALGPDFLAAAKHAFVDAMSIAMTVGAIGAVAGAVVALAILPKGEKKVQDAVQPVDDPVH